MKVLFYREYLFKNIGKRIRDFRTNIKKETQIEMSDKLQNHHIHMDRYRLSAIENGKTDKRKNPHLLSGEHIKVISEYMGCSPKELIFGDEKERSDFIKLVLLGIIVNGDRHYQSNELINPIINIGKAEFNITEFARISMLNIDNKELQRKITEVFIDTARNPSKTLVNECVKWLKTNYVFFAEPVQHQNMNYLLNEHDSELEVHSNLLIKILFSNEEFALEFLDGKFNIAKLTSETRENLNNLINHQGQYGGLALDWKEVGYSKFIKAFNQMWTRNMKSFIEYFERNLFNIDLVEDGLKNQNDIFFRELITQSEFQNLLYNILNKERYDTETMVGHRIAQNYIDSYLIDLDDDLKEIDYDSGYNLYKYNYDIHQLTQSYNMSRDELNNKKDSLFLYINGYFNQK